MFRGPKKVEYGDGITVEERKVGMVNYIYVTDGGVETRLGIQAELTNDEKKIGKYKLFDTDNKLVMTDDRLVMHVNSFDKIHSEFVRLKGLAQKKPAKSQSAAEPTHSPMMSHQQQDERRLSPHNGEYGRYIPVLDVLGQNPPRQGMNQSSSVLNTSGYSALVPYTANDELVASRHQSGMNAVQVDPNVLALKMQLRMLEQLKAPEHSVETKNRRLSEIDSNLNDIQAKIKNDGQITSPVEVRILLTMIRNARREVEVSMHSQPTNDQHGYKRR